MGPNKDKNYVVAFLVFYVLLFAAVVGLSGCKVRQEPGGPPIGYPGSEPYPVGPKGPTPGTK
jgi:hypothetical protein